MIRQCYQLVTFNITKKLYFPLLFYSKFYSLYIQIVIYLNYLETYIYIHPSYVYISISISKQQALNNFNNIPLFFSLKCIPSGIFVSFFFKLKSTTKSFLFYSNNKKIANHSRYLASFKCVCICVHLFLNVRANLTKALLNFKRSASLFCFLKPF